MNYLKRGKANTPFNGVKLNSSFSYSSNKVYLQGLQAEILLENDESYKNSSINGIKNPNMELFLLRARQIKIKAEDVIGRDVQDAIPNSRIHEVLVDGQAHINEFQDVGQVRIVTGRNIENDDRAVHFGIQPTQGFLRPFIRFHRKMARVRIWSHRT